jgi:hypothetical protein
MMVCINCTRDVYFINGDSVHQEAVACPGNGTIGRATAFQYVIETRIATCINKANKTLIALPNRTGCTTCPPGSCRVLQLAAACCN